jgi:hypothetical protein
MLSSFDRNVSWMCETVFACSGWARRSRRASALQVSGIAVRTIRVTFSLTESTLASAKELEDGKTFYEVEGKKGDEKAALKIDESGKQPAEEKD